MIHEPIAQLPWQLARAATHCWQGEREAVEQGAERGRPQARARAELA